MSGDVFHHAFKVRGESAPLRSSTNRYWPSPPSSPLPQSHTRFQLRFPHAVQDRVELQRHRQRAHGIDDLRIVLRDAAACPCDTRSAHRQRRLRDIEIDCTPKQPGELPAEQTK